jgi:3-dehydroquinate synthase
MLVDKNNSIILNQNLDSSYPVYFTKNLFNGATKYSNLLSSICKRKVFIVIDKNVNRIYGKKIAEYFSEKSSDYRIHEFDALEADKNLKTIEKLCRLAKEFDMRRDSVFIAIGGGITMDIAGFAAFIYRKKIPYVRIPTTLVGVVDAGVGIKVGINFSGSKNFLGGFYPPYAVFNDLSFLGTLTEKEIRCGLFEILKMAIIKDKKLFKLLNQECQNILDRRFSKKTEKINYVAARSMMEELEKNLYEKDLKRSVDFGHTFSPFIEIFSAYSIPHGEAVGVDILISSYISLIKGILSKKDFSNITTSIKLIGFTKKYTLPKEKDLYDSLYEIRKHRAKNLNLVLPFEIGKAIFTNECSLDEIKKTYKFLAGTGLFN